MDPVFGKVQNHPKYSVFIACLIVVLIICAAAYNTWDNYKNHQAELHQAALLTMQQAQDANVLQNKLEMNKQNAAMFADFVKSVQAGQVQPVTHFTIQAPSAEQAAAQVVSRINANDPTLPPEAVASSDNTTVAPRQLTSKEVEDAKQKNAANKDSNASKINETYGVGVYKNNNYRNWEWSMGYGIHHSDPYIPVGLQRNYSKDRAIAIELHVDPGEVIKLSGGEVKYVVKTNKLFFLF